MGKVENNPKKSHGDFHSGNAPHIQQNTGGLTGPLKFMKPWLNHSIKRLGFNCLGLAGEKAIAHTQKMGVATHKEYARASRLNNTFWDWGKGIMFLATFQKTETIEAIIKDIKDNHKKEEKTRALSESYTLVRDKSKVEVAKLLQ